MNKKIIAYLFLANCTIGLFLLVYLPAKAFFNQRYVLDKYGLAFNAQREANGLYPIPEDWAAECLDSCVIWKNPVGKLGHRWKNVGFRGRRIVNELDLFSFGYDSSIGKYTKTLTVETEYDDNEMLKNRIYSLEIGDKSSLISSVVADSLLNSLK